MTISVRQGFFAALLERIQARLPDTASLDGLSQAETDLLAVATVQGLIGNGGHLFWYEGMDREDTLRAADALERMELLRAASALRRSLQVFPDAQPPKELEERRRFLALNRDRLKAALDPLDRAMWQIDFDAAARFYALRRRTELIQANPDLLELFAEADGRRER